MGLKQGLANMWGATVAGASRIKKDPHKVVLQTNSGGEATVQNLPSGQYKYKIVLKDGRDCSIVKALGNKALLKSSLVLVPEQENKFTFTVQIPQIAAVVEPSRTIPLKFNKRLTPSKPMMRIFLVMPRRSPVQAYTTWWDLFWERRANPYSDYNVILEKDGKIIEIAPGMIKKRSPTTKAGEEVPKLRIVHGQQGFLRKPEKSKERRQRDADIEDMKLVTGKSYTFLRRITSNKDFLISAIFTEQELKQIEPGDYTIKVRVSSQMTGKVEMDAGKVTFVAANTTTTSQTTQASPQIAATQQAIEEEASTRKDAQVDLSFIQTSKEKKTYSPDEEVTFKLKAVLNEESDFNGQPLDTILGTIKLGADKGVIFINEKGEQFARDEDGVIPLPTNEKGETELIKVKLASAIAETVTLSASCLYAEKTNHKLSFYPLDLKITEKKVNEKEEGKECFITLQLISTKSQKPFTAKQYNLLFTPKEGIPKTYLPENIKGKNALYVHKYIVPKNATTAKIEIASPDGLFAKITVDLLKNITTEKPKKKDAYDITITSVKRVKAEPNDELYITAKFKINNRLQTTKLLNIKTGSRIEPFSSSRNKEQTIGLFITKDTKTLPAELFYEENGKKIASTNIADLLTLTTQKNTETSKINQQKQSKSVQKVSQEDIEQLKKLPETFWYEHEDYELFERLAAEAITYAPLIQKEFKDYAVKQFAVILMLTIYYHKHKKHTKKTQIKTVWEEAHKDNRFTELITAFTIEKELQKEVVANPGANIASLGKKMNPQAIVAEVVKEIELEKKHAGKTTQTQNIVKTTYFAGFTNGGFQPNSYEYKAGESKYANFCIEALADGKTGYLSVIDTKKENFQKQHEYMNKTLPYVAREKNHYDPKTHTTITTITKGVVVKQLAENNTPIWHLQQPVIVQYE